MVKSRKYFYWSPPIKRVTRKEEVRFYLWKLRAELKNHFDESIKSHYYDSVSVG